MLLAEIKTCQYFAEHHRSEIFKAPLVANAMNFRLKDETYFLFQPAMVL